MNDKELSEYIEEKQDEIAMTAASLFFQEEMLDQAEVLDIQGVIDALSIIIDEGEDYLAWKELYPILKRCVV